METGGRRAELLLWGGGAGEGPGLRLSRLVTDMGGG